MSENEKSAWWKRALRETEVTNARKDKMREHGDPATKERVLEVLDHVIGTEGEPADAIEYGTYLSALAAAVASLLPVIAADVGTNIVAKTRRERAARALALVHAVEAIARARFAVDLRPHGDVLTRTSSLPGPGEEPRFEVERIDDRVVPEADLPRAAEDLGEAKRDEVEPEHDATLRPGHHIGGFHDD